jgi:hypothetical protein
VLDHYKLPGWLTVLQAVAWIALRDFESVILAGSAVTLSSSQLQAKCAGTALTFELFDQTRRARSAAEQAEGMDAELALAALLRALEGLGPSKIYANGQRVGTTITEQISNLDWPQLTLRPGYPSPSDIAVCLRVEQTHQRPSRIVWEDVRLLGEDVSRAWPALRGPTELSYRQSRTFAHMELVGDEVPKPAHPARSEFIWAGDALRLLAFGEVVTPHPPDMELLSAWRAVQQGSTALCDALAQGKLVAQGGRATWVRRQRTQSVFEAIPASFFSDPAATINLASWAVFDSAKLGWEEYQLARQREAQEWAHVMLPADFRSHLPGASVAEPEDEKARYRTGVQGRPSSRQYVEAEFERRREANLASPSLGQEAAYLTQWLAETHPQAPRMKARGIENAIREIYGELRKSKATK